jgi:hypothetical protein
MKETTKELQLQIKRTEVELKYYSLLIKQERLKNRKFTGKKEPSSKKAKYNEKEEQEPSEQQEEEEEYEEEEEEEIPKSKIQTRSMSIDMIEDSDYKDFEEPTSSQEESVPMTTPVKTKSPPKKKPLTPKKTPREESDDSDDEENTDKAKDALFKLDDGIALNWSPRESWTMKTESAKCLSEFIEVLLDFIDNPTLKVIFKFNIQKMKMKIEKISNFKQLWELFSYIASNIDKTQFKNNFDVKKWLNKLK